MQSRLTPKRFRMVRSGAVLGLTGLLLTAVPCVSPGGSAAWAQDLPAAPVEDLLNADGRRVMPEGWQALPVEALVIEVERYYSPPWGTDAESDQIITHVWQTYLSDEALMSEGDWPVVESLVRVIGSRLGAPDGLTTDAERASFAQVFRERVASEVSGGQMDFEVMRVALDTLAKQGVPQRDRSALAAGWCDGRDLSALTLRQQSVLCDVLRDSAVDPRNMSGVYEGTINIPQAGAYTFDRYLADGVYANDWVVVQVGGQVVLDTRPNEDGDATIWGPVDLPSGGQAFTATFFRGDDPEAGDDVGPVEHVLCWKAPGSREEEAAVLIPGSAFGQAGLTARYYNGAPEGDLAMGQTVPGVDRIDSSFGQRHGALLDEVRGQLTSPQRVAGWYQELEDDPLAAPSALAWVFRNACMSLGAADRAALTDAVCGQHPAWVGAIDTGWQMKTVMYALAGVPPEVDGGGAMSTLVGTWAANRPRFQTRIGAYPSWSPTGYLKLNDDAHAHLGYVLGGREAQWPVMQAICEESMTEPGGTCDIDILKLYLETAKIADRSAGREQGLGTVRAYIDDVLTNDALSGDARATWLVARGISDEAQTGDAIPLPAAGWRYFERALVAAESVEIRFWVLSEMMTRAISMGEEDLAVSLLSSLEHQFPATEVAPGKASAEGNPMTYAEVFQGWRDQAAHYGAWRRDVAAREELNQRVLAARGEVEALEADLEVLDAGDARRRGIVTAQLQEARSSLEALEAEQAARDE